jgi:hypothetical protein
MDKMNNRIIVKTAATLSILAMSTVAIAQNDPSFPGEYAPVNSDQSFPGTTEQREFSAATLRTVF